MSLRIIDARAYRRALAVRDLTDAAHGPHALQLLVQSAIETLRAAWSCPAVVYRAPALVAIADNYDDLHYPHDGAARDARHTRYVSTSQLLRTQTSAMMPRALRMLAPAAYDDVLIACPGLTYRRDTIDRLHVGEPHQLDLWRVRSGALTRDDLVGMIECVASALVPGAPLRLTPTTTRTPSRASRYMRRWAVRGSRSSNAGSRCRGSWRSRATTSAIRASRWESASIAC